MEAVQVASQLRNIKTYLRLVYKNCIKSVNPKLLVRQELIKKNDSLIIRNIEYKLEKNCYIVGFGKAVLDMALETEEIIGEHVRGGAVSIPEGLVSHIHSPMPKMIQVFQGAKGNQPDEKAYMASKYIVNLTEKLSEKDLLIVLVSGGGSTLFPYPIPPVTLEEKLNLTKSLSLAGAEIRELNAVRKSLSVVKGGKLAKLAYPAKVVTLVLSDVVNDHLDSIASGPTFPDKKPKIMAMDVLKKYDLMKAVPSHVIDVLNKVDVEDETKYFKNSAIHVIGNNGLALQAAEEFAANDNYISKIMTSSLQGDVKIVARAMAKLAGLLCQALSKTITIKVFTEEVLKLNKKLCITDLRVEELAKLILNSSTKNKVCLLFGGETTVKVTGKGIGGRNQEIALRFSLALDELATSLRVIDLFNVVVLCAGTDGIDGPTDAAGAISYNGQTKHGSLQKLNVEEFVRNNNSYNYYSVLNKGEDLLKYGMTGTNVMDINILTIQPKI